jgi:hypothetical protein
MTDYDETEDDAEDQQAEDAAEYLRSIGVKP